MSRLFTLLAGPILAFSSLFMASSTLAQPYTITQDTADLTPLTAPTAVSLADDQTAGPFNIGFDFNFFGTTYSEFWISSNGFIAFENTSNGCCSGQLIPNSGQPNNMIAAFYEDYDPPEGGTVSYSLEGNIVGARSLIIEFDQIYPWNGPPKTPSTWQIKLQECTNIIEIHCESCVSDGGSHTQGIENAAGDDAYFVAGRNSTDFSLTDDQVIFDPDLVTCQAETPEPALPVPTLGTLSALLMTLVLLIIGTIVLRRSAA
ncbi:hypothetical protein DZC52_03675 [Wenzhouxiangella sediminis]|uniref:PEP-CTERM sorting domain-containing protein n=2 Tax=Wenzhouxiangella sediminis TaxID=1792836 RepID=A0A3E1KB82_9GAMM|nr:hypothetical protein DZC52_03675 [Wenzhouxiangella sediminis]